MMKPKIEYYCPHPATPIRDPQYFMRLITYGTDEDFIGVEVFVNEIYEGIWDQFIAMQKGWV